LKPLIVTGAPVAHEQAVEHPRAARFRLRREEVERAALEHLAAAAEERRLRPPSRLGGRAGVVDERRDVGDVDVEGERERGVLAPAGDVAAVRVELALADEALHDLVERQAAHVRSIPRLTGAIEAHHPLGWARCGGSGP
jgi:hypothetical protein